MNVFYLTLMAYFVYNYDKCIISTYLLRQT